MFLFSAAILLLGTGFLKLIGVTQDAPFLRNPDPLVTFMSIRQLALLAAVIEITVASIIFSYQSNRLKLALILWLAVLFTTYRVGLATTGFNGICPCLGGTLQWLIRDKSVVDWTLKAIIAYLALMSSLFLIRDALSPRIAQESGSRQIRI